MRVENLYITYCWPFCNSFGDNFDCHGVVNVLKGLLSKGSSVSVWLLNKLFNMETIIQNQGLQHIVEKSLMCIDKNCINSFRLVNNDCKGITESSRVLRVLKVRKLASDIKGFLVNCDIFNYHWDSEVAESIY